ncbi:MAG: excinuclease ABC subunit UvrC [Rhodospirillales bacterium]|nr:excinuclease ABC subunit UvrC [Rhodospirillales bacterium]
MLGTTAHIAEMNVQADGAPGVIRGAAVIVAALKTVPKSPGIYRMRDERGQVLYVGKAKSLTRRLVAYTRPDRLSTRIARMIAATAAVDVVTTHTEVEALLLESNLIKREKPRYNILLRDDKSFPYVLLTGDHDWPQLLKHRGLRNRTGEYFGPFASAGAVNQTLHTLQRAFPLRSCSDSVFAARTRPCLQYQIKRCTAPCVGRIKPETYGAIVGETRDFLLGRSRDLTQRLAGRMQDSSDALEFEAAAVYRDRIQALAHIQAHQDINVLSLGEADIVAVAQQGAESCVQVFFYRAGHNFGNRTYFPAHTADHSPSEVIASFLGQFYADKEPPELVLVSHAPQAPDLLIEALSVRAGKRVGLIVPRRGVKKKLVEHALLNAREALARHMSESATQRKLLEGVADSLALDGPPRRIEIYDNSHIQGANALGAMVVAGAEGFVKAAYRTFNIKSAELAPGDDYGMLREVLMRRFARALREDPDRESGNWPDLVLIDGGAGQLSVARAVFAELGIEDVPLLAIAKGPDRDAGRESFFAPERPPFTLPPGDPVLFFLQRLRDEAHRFAIGAHRAKRKRAITASPLDEVAGVGARRKRALLHHFGSADGVATAGLKDLEQVEGVSTSLAKKIYDHFHPEG